MSNRAILISAILLSLPAQYLTALGLRLQLLGSQGVAPRDGRVGDFGCSDFHSSSLYPCTLAEMLSNVLGDVIGGNFLSLGLVTVGFAMVVAALLWGLRFVFRRVAGQ